MDSQQRDAYYEVFWVLPNAPLPVPGDLHPIDDESLPDPVINKRKELQRTLASLDLTQTEAIQEAIGCCDLYVRSLRAARAVDEPIGMSTWKSAITAETTTVPLAFDEPMALVLQATLLLDLGTNLAHKMTLECIPEAAQCFCQAAGLVEYIITLEEDICSSLQADVPVELPELAPRILHGLVDVAVVMAQQLAIVKATLFPVDTPYTASVLQKLHAACQFGYESFETAVVRSCYSARPKRQGCVTLLGYATIFSRLHRAQVLQIAGELEFASGAAYGKAIAFATAALRQLQARQSMRDVGLPPLEPDGGLYHQYEWLFPRIEAKRDTLQDLVADWTKDNDAIYFDTIPPEETVLSVEIARALIMKPVEHHIRNRLGSARMFREITPVPVNGTDNITKLESSESEHDDHEDHDEGDGTDADGAGDHGTEATPEPVFSPLVNDTSSEEDVHPVSEGSFSSVAREPSMVVEDRPATTSVVTKKHAKSLVDTRPAELPGLTPPFVRARMARRMATQLLPQKSHSSRRMLDAIGKRDSLLTLQQTEEELRKALTDEALARMRRTLLIGADVYRFAKDQWKKEVLRVKDDHVVLVRKMSIALLSKQQKFPWSSVHAFQHELQPMNQVLQLLAPPGKRMTSILVIARLGDTVEPTEMTFKTPEENAIAVACLQQIHQEKRAASGST